MPQMRNPNPNIYRPYPASMMPRAQDIKDNDMMRMASQPKPRKVQTVNYIAPTGGGR